MLGYEDLWELVFHSAGECTHRSRSFYDPRERRRGAHCHRLWKDDGKFRYYPRCRGICRFFKRRK